MTTPDTPDTPDEELTPEERLEATIWRILRVIYLRVELKVRSDHRTPVELTLEEGNDILSPWFPVMQTDLDILKECVHQGRLLGVNDVHSRLHGAEGVDHEMLDQAVEYGGDRE